MNRRGAVSRRRDRRCALGSRRRCGRPPPRRDRGEGRSPEPCWIGLPSILVGRPSWLSTINPTDVAVDDCIAVAKWIGTPRDRVLRRAAVGKDLLARDVGCTPLSPAAAAVAPPTATNVAPAEAQAIFARTWRCRASTLARCLGSRALPPAARGSRRSRPSRASCGEASPGDRRELRFFDRALKGGMSLDHR